VRKSSLELIKAVLHDLLEASPYLRAAAVLRVSGLTVEAIMPPTIQQEYVSAMSAAMLLLGERITAALHSGQLDKVYIKGAEGHIILMSVNSELVLNVQAADRAPLGLLFMEMRQAVERLKKLI